MLGDDTLVFDSVTHLYDMSDGNVKTEGGDMFRNHLFGFHQYLTPDDDRILGEEEFLREWDAESVADVVFRESDVDLLVAQPLPLTDFFHDGLSSWEKCAAMAERYSDRMVFWGTVNPMEGDRALELMERQVEEFDAKAFKLYNVRYDYGEPFPWRMDDPRIAFPIFEKARELGVDLIGVHKGVPLGPQPIEGTELSDIDRAAAEFPDLDFMVFHPGMPFLDELLWQVVRFDNVYASLAATINFIDLAPRKFAETIGKLLFWGGPEKIVYGSEVPLFHPQWALEQFWEFEMPQDLVEGYGYPQLTPEIKRMILSENLAELMDVDLASKRDAIADDEFARRRAEEDRPEPWESVAF